MKKFCCVSAARDAAVILILLCCLSMLTACFFSNDELSYDKLLRRFNADRDEIEAVVADGGFERAADLKWIRDVEIHDRYVDFYCGGSGLGSQTNYTGFFYTPDDDPLAMWRQNDYSCYVLTPDDFVQTEEGWEYREHDHNEFGDNYYSVRKLAPNYYYYYLHF